MSDELETRDADRPHFIVHRSSFVVPQPFLPPAIARAIRVAGGPGDAVFVVGGYVRDRLLGRPTRDVDITVSTDPRLVANRLGRSLAGKVFPLSTEHGAWRVTLPDAVGELAQIDVAAMRGMIDADLGERDFTVNAIAATPEGDDPRDPFGGAADARAGVLRLVTPEAVRADPVRSLRAVRHAAELGFAIEPGSAAVIRRDAALIGRVAGERQRDEIVRALDTPRGAASIRLMDSLGLLDQVLPELRPAKGCPQPQEHFWDVFDHSVETVALLDCILAAAPVDDACAERVARLVELWPEWPALRTRWDGESGEGRSRRAVLKLIGLLHDVAKPETRTIQPDGRMRFFSHPERGAVVAGEVFRRLRFSAREVKLAELLVGDHLRPGQLAAPGALPTARALYRLFREHGEDLPDLLTLNLADGAAAAGPRQTSEQWRGHVAYSGWILRQRTERESLVKPRRLVTGTDLMTELGLPPGPALGRLLDALAEAEATGEVNSREEALDRARALSRTMSDERRERSPLHRSSFIDHRSNLR